MNVHVITTSELEEMMRQAFVYARSQEQSILTKAELAKHFKVSGSTINRWMRAGMPYFGGGRPRYNKEECERWKYEQQNI